MRITPKFVIKDGGHVYEPDIECDVDDEVGRRFVILGWATSPDYSPDGVTPTAAATDLSPDSVTHTASSMKPQEV